jgi:membrane AbrB-like protein
MAYLVRFHAWDRTSAFYASIPGARSYVMAMTFASNANARSVVIVQSVRLLLLVAVLPGLLVVAGLGGGRAPPAPHAALSWLDYPLLFVASVVVGLGADRLGIPAGATVGAMLASAVLHATGLVTASIPQPLMIIGFVVIGVFIAERFAGTSIAEFRELAGAACGAFLVGTLASILVGLGVAAITGLPVGKVILAYAPGGIEAMTILAFVLDIDPAFVGAHHIARFLGIALLLPLAARLVLGPQPPPGTQGDRAD